MKIKDSLYIKILIWAYEKQDAGFSFRELREEFNLTHDQEQWVLKVFHSNIPIGDNLINLCDYRKEEHIYVITSKGISAAVEYLNLKEAKSSAKRAEIIALVAIGIGIIVGVLQIICACN